MQEFVCGQRWINDAQLQMGLGSVLKTDVRTVTVLFTATGETFVYARGSVPLTRVRFVSGDLITTRDNLNLEVVEVEEQNGLLTYLGKDSVGNIHQIHESLLSNHVQLNQPSERLFNGQIDPDLWFELRYKTRQARSDNNRNALQGLIGGRVSLIPHQLYIAHTVSSRYAPRVLLADEVGLGKTIEAGMIIHQQLITERAQRILIVVPESLVHQWLVEMLRRFNLMFRIFDETRFDSLVDIDEPGDRAPEGQVNPFLTEQLVLCSLEFLSSRPEVFRQCRDSGWDLLVVDEAHHLQWSEDDPGFEYQLIGQLAASTKGILLLTATPEQLGRSSHYARLRLLDPERFPGYQDFIDEENRYQPLANIVDSLLGEGQIQDSMEKVLGAFVGGKQAAEMVRKLNDEVGDRFEKKQVRESLAQILLDRHGTGRVLFRNTRATVKGFPERKVSPCPLDIPDAYRCLLKTFESGSLSDAQLLLCPELLFQVMNEVGPDWTSLDPRVDALVKLLRQIKPEKVLVIAASADTALDLSAHLKIRQGIDVSVFHENMSMIERDRAAAWFADRISGSQVLICSEMGSEGRNFQFAHHLVLFDLPLDPDLLEQRIGRLDRIGQLETVQIHVMYIKQTAQQIMYDWYQQGLDAFHNTCPTGYQVYSRLETAVLERLHHPDQDYSDLIEKTAELHSQCMVVLQQGRDRLVEFNSCRPKVAEKLKAEAMNQDNESGLQEYMELVFDCFGVENEPALSTSDRCYAINPGVHMVTPFPNLPEDGLTVTYDRETALSREDVSFLSWDHPLVSGAMDLIEASEFGNTSVISTTVAGVARGTFLVETIFMLESASTIRQHSGRYLPPTLFRILIDQTGRWLKSDAIRQAEGSTSEKLEPNMTRRIVRMKGNLLRKMVVVSKNYAEKLTPSVVQAAQDKSTDMLMSEIKRLEALRQVNPNVRQEEIDFHQKQLEIIADRLNASSLRLDAIRVIIAT